MSHIRKVCPHDVVITQCRCIHYGGKPTEVVWPCPFGDGPGQNHEGYAVVHPNLDRPALNRICPKCGGPLRTDTFINMAGSSVRQLCIARGCGWSDATAGPHEPPQAPEGEPMTPGPVSQVPPGASGGAEGFGPRAVKACVFRTCAWTLPEESRPTLATARRREEEQLIDHLQAEHAEAIRQMWEAIR